MGFCDHCQGQRFDRAQVLRTLRAARKRLETSSTTCTADEMIAAAIEAVRALDIPHLETMEDLAGEVVH